MEHAFMKTISEALCEKGILVVRFEFEYMAKRRLDGLKYPPNRQPQAMAYFTEVVKTLQDEPRIPTENTLIVGGKSMGGRIATLMAHENAEALGIHAVICLGFPFYAPKKPRVAEHSRGQHLYDMTTPTLILQGNRDTFASKEEVLALPLSNQVTCEFLPDGDHSFKPRVKSGETYENNIHQAIHAMVSFMTTPSPLIAK